MHEIETVEAVAALWFTVVFGAALLAPLFGAGCKAARRTLDKHEERKR